MAQLFIHGGPGSGHKGHKGIKGQVGGSLPGHGTGVSEQDDPFDDKSGRDIDKFYDDLNGNLEMLHVDEQQALEYYTGDGYAIINDYHRGRGNPVEEYAEAHGMDTEDLEDAKAGLQDQIDSIDSVFRKKGAEAPENMLLHRNVGFHPERSQGMIDFFKKAETSGGTFSDKGYLSTTVSEHVADTSFSAGRAEVLHSFRIQVPKGTKMFPVDNWSSNPGEYEIIFPRDTKFEIISSRWNKDENEQQVLLKVIQ